MANFKLTLSPAEHDRAMIVLEKFLAYRAAGKPVALNFGAGLDSAAVRVLFAYIGIEPGITQFADTGGEKDMTYEWLGIFNDWLEAQGLEKVVTTRYREVVNMRPTTPYGDLTSAMLYSESLPGISYMFQSHSCSIKWKGDVLERHLLGRKRDKSTGVPAFRKAHEAGIKPVIIMGFDWSPADQKRANKGRCKMGALPSAKNFETWYPLHDMKWSRPRLAEIVAEAGLPVPPKSACYYCAASKKWELLDLAAREPHNFIKALEMEDKFLVGKHKEKNKSVKGLGATWNWREWATELGIIESGGHQVVMAKETLLAMAAETMPATAGTVQLTMSLKKAA